jgi:hypothetical protein
MMEESYRKTTESGQRLKVKSALNPVLWLCGIITAPTLGLGAVNPDLATWVIVIGCAPTIVALFSYLYFMFTDKDRLQSEEFQIQKRTIELAQQKGEPSPHEPKNVPITSNPELPVIEHHDTASAQ